MINDLPVLEEIIISEGITIFTCIVSICLGCRYISQYLKDKKSEKVKMHSLLIQRFININKLHHTPKATDLFLNSIITKGANDICIHYSACSINDNWKSHQIYVTPIMNPNNFKRIATNVWKNIKTMEIYEENLTEINYKVYKIDKYSKQYNLDKFKYIRWNGIHD
jgi:hypothetical protein